MAGDVLAEAEALTADADCFHENGADVLAAALAERAFSLRERALGRGHPEVAASLNNVGVFYRGAGAYEKARSCYDRALQIFEEAFGPNHPHLVGPLNNLAHLCQVWGAYDEAGRLFERALALLKGADIGEHVDVTDVVNNLAALHMTRGAYDEAGRLFERALAARERLLGKEHPKVAQSLNNLASLRQARGDYEGAGALFERALRIEVRALGPEHRRVGTTLQNLASLCQARGEYDRAESLYLSAVDVFEKVLGEGHVDGVCAHSNLATLYQEQGRYAEAEQLLARALAIRERALGSEHPQVATCLTSMAGLYQTLGAYDEAQTHFERALAIWQTSFGPDHPEVSTGLNNLASLYVAKGAYPKAEQLYLQALDVCLKVLGEGHPRAFPTLHNLGSLYKEQGAYDEAESFLLQALGGREQKLGPEHPDVAATLHNLATLYQVQSRNAEAEARLGRALTIWQTSLGPEHPNVAGGLSAMGALLGARGAAGEARAHHEKALALYQKAFGAEHPAVATCCNNLAALCWEQGAYDEAQTLFERAQHIWEGALGGEHPNVAAALGNLAGLNQARGAKGRACSYAVRAAELHERHLALNLAPMSEPRKRAFLQALRGDTEWAASFHAHDAPDDDGALRLALSTTLRRKGRVLDELASAQATLWRNPSPELGAEYDDFRRKRAELSARRHASAAGYDDSWRALAAEVERREGALSSKIAAYQAPTEPVTIEAVQAKLSAGSALVEFLRYHRFDPGGPGRWRDAHYAAYVLQREGPPIWVALGEAGPIEASIARTRAALVSPGVAPRDVLRELDALVFAPVRRLLGSTDRFLLSPDASLHLVPFAALVDEEGRHLVERAHINYLTSGRDLLRSPTQAEPRTAPLVMAVAESGGAYPPLPGATAEAEAIRACFPQAELLVGAAATKRALAGVRAPLFIHVATHGFLGMPSAPSPSRSARSWRGPRDLAALECLTPPLDEGVNLEDALDDAGIVLMRDGTGGDVMTAREVAGLDLGGTQLVVLSACETGVGRVASGEGVYGLRRALTIAGAEAQVVSLWKVDDEATAALMGRYYGGLRRSEGRSEALRRAQLAMLSEPEHAHPYYWAAFVPIGDERPLRLRAGR